MFKNLGYQFNLQFYCFIKKLYKNRNFKNTKNKNEKSER